MTTPKELSSVIGVDPKSIRRFARKQFGKPEGTWNFSFEQVQVIKEHFAGSNPAPQQRTDAVATPVKGNQKLKEAVRRINPDHDWNTEAGLTEYARNWLKEHYDLDLEVPIWINARLTRALGHFKHYPTKPHSISIGRRTIDYYGKEATLDVLKHELVHYACFMKGMPHQDGDYYFENELKRLGISSTQTYKAKGEFHTYYCTSCGERTSYRARKRKNIQRYSSRCCNAPIRYGGKEFIDNN